MNRAILFMLLAGAASLGVDASVNDNVKDLVRDGKFLMAREAMGKSHEISAVEKDSLVAIMQRIRADFNLTFDDGVKAIQTKFPHATLENINDWVGKRYIEVKEIDGKRYMFRKTVSNLDRLVPELSAARKSEQIKNDSEYMAYAIDAMSVSDNGAATDKHRVTIKFSITVKPDVVPEGKVLRVWCPFPVENTRQSNAKLISANCKKLEFSEGKSLHNTVYMEQKAKKGIATVFEYEFSYDVASQYFSPEYIRANKKPYDISSDLYKRYTSTELPQIVVTEKTKELAKKIVGNATDPLEQASLIYDWIDAYFPWAGAREYSTIENLAQYVLDNGHGDCGQVSLLYITLLRSLGIPAKWESGWMLHPGKVGMHDWAEVYYEGVGWVPVDMSFGLLEVSEDESVRNFYKTGIDMYRFASNEGVGCQLFPKKKYVRSETVDFQLGEVEYDGGNLFYYKDWTPKFELISIEKINNSDE